MSVLTFDCRVILVHKVRLDKLNGQAGFSDTTATDYDQLVLAEELRLGQRGSGARADAVVGIPWTP